MLKSSLSKGTGDKGLKIANSGNDGRNPPTGKRAAEKNL
jgi:hypothetical protein